MKYATCWPIPAIYSFDFFAYFLQIIKRFSVKQGMHKFKENFFSEYSHQFFILKFRLRVYAVWESHILLKTMNYILTLFQRWFRVRSNTSNILLVQNFCKSRLLTLGEFCKVIFQNFYLSETGKMIQKFKFLSYARRKFFPEKASLPGR